jgi:hypothetical protein
MSKASATAWGLTAAVLALITAWTLAQQSPPAAEDQETQITLLPLTGPLADSEAELSGLAWHGDEHLVFLPQYRSVRECPSSAGCLYVLGRAQIESFLDGSTKGPLTPAIMTIEATDMPEIEGFEGYEAIAFYNDDAYLLAESETADNTAAHLFRGHLDLARGQLILDVAQVPTLVPPRAFPNLSYESLIVAEHGVLALPEIHGAATDLYALRFDLGLTSMTRVPFTAVDYRLTDVTAVNSDGEFWGLNVHWPGLATEALDDATSSATHAVERILKLHWNTDGVECEVSPAVVIRSIPGTTQVRNWEGLVRFGDRGFLIVTDQYPTSLFAFVPHVFGP